MATYKVPQDVEADDKLLGPFTFRQFIYLLVVVALGFVAWGLAQLSVILIVIPLPFIVLFGALAAPLRKDQPMEIYLAAIISFYVKPRQRRWDPEGIESMIEITAPKTVEVALTKDLSEHEAEQRLSYLANIVDSGGWAIRGTATGPMGVPGAGVINSDIYREAQDATDVFDTNTSVAHGFDVMMGQRSVQMHEEAREHMMQALQQQSMVQQAPQLQPQPQVQPYTQTQPQPPAPIYTMPLAPADMQLPQQPYFNPYPDFQQSVIQPLNDPSHQTVPAYTAPVATAAAAIIEEKAPTTSDTEFTAGIINLANNNPDLSVETLAHEAERLKKKAQKAADPDEVVISLR